MNYYCIITITSLVTIGLMQFTSADMMSRIIFTGSGTCTSTESDKIKAIFGPNAISSNRALLRSNNDHRSLRDCKGSCLGKVWCYAAGCWGNVGRELRDTERELQTCTDVLNSYHTKLDALRSQVSSSCSSLIGTKASRNSTCLNDVIYGQITGARLYEVPTSGSAVVKKDFIPATGYSFCKSMRFSIEALGDACIDDMDITLTGPNNYYKDRYELTAPYFLFGDYNGAPFGNTVSSTGTYTLTVKPYNNGDYMVEKIKTFTFTINNC